MLKLTSERMVRVPSGLLTCLLKRCADKTLLWDCSFDMRKFFILVFMLFGSVVQGAEEPTILIFGDSLSAGYGIEVDRPGPLCCKRDSKAKGTNIR